MSLCYAAAGINHFIHPEMYIAIMPPWLPAHAALVFLSGLMEVLLAILLIIPFTRRFAAWGIILLLIAVFPANIQMMLNYHNEENPQFWLTILRLPLQLVLIWWAFQYTGYKYRK
jgi:uncharacterized membrane protein